VRSRARYDSSHPGFDLRRGPWGYRIEYADGIRHGRQVTVIIFWSGIAVGGGPDEPLIFCTCAGIRCPAGRRPRLLRQPPFGL
jgi:hypothetical protein